MLRRRRCSARRSRCSTGRGRRRCAGPRRQVLLAGRRRCGWHRSSALRGSRSGGCSGPGAACRLQRSADALPCLCVLAVGRGVETIQGRAQCNYGEGNPDRHVGRATNGEVLIHGLRGHDGIHDARRLETGQPDIDRRREPAGRAFDGGLWGQLLDMSRRTRDRDQRAAAVAEHQRQASHDPAPERRAMAAVAVRGLAYVGSG